MPLLYIKYLLFVFIMAIITICTGGTICANPSLSGYGLIAGNLPELVKKKLLKMGSNIVYTKNIFSENLSISDLRALVEKIEMHVEHNIIILAGSDNLTFMAKYVAASIVNRKIFFISTQRTADMPTFEGVKKLHAVQHCIDRVSDGAYIVNMQSECIYEFLDPFSCQKTWGYAKNCFKGIINYSYHTLENQLRIYRPVKNFKLNTINMCVKPSNIMCIHSLPDLKFKLPRHISHVIVIGTGLCNISFEIRQIIKRYTDVKFFVVNNLYGLKYKVYDAVDNAPNEFIKSQNVELAYLKILYDPSYSLPL